MNYLEEMAKARGRAPKSGELRSRTTISIDAELLETARERVAQGRAESLSALFENALRKDLEGGQLRELLDELDEIYGPPSKEAREWAAEVIASVRSS